MANRLCAIVHGKVLDSAASIFLEDAVVLIDGKRIAAVGAPQQVPVPEGAEIVAADGGYVVPGLIEGHNHLYLDGAFEPQSLDPEPTILLRAIRNARIQLCDGVTTLRDCGTPKFLDLYVRDAVKRGDIPGPHLISSGPWVTASHGHGAFPGACSIADGPDEVRKAVREILRHGVDFLKIFISGGTATAWAGPTQAFYTFDEVRVAVEEAHNVGKQVCAHIHGGPGVKLAVEAGIDTLEHGSYITDDGDIELIARKGVAWMFNQGARVADPNPNLPQFEQDKILASRATSMTAFKKAKAAGVRIISGADGHHENHAFVWSLEALVKCGATPTEALRAATVTPAEVFGISAERGTLEKGKFADLLVVDADPLKDISALRQLRLVMKEGKVYNGL